MCKGGSPPILGESPKHLISDKGGQFTAPGFTDWCSRRGIEPRYAAVLFVTTLCTIQREFSPPNQVHRIDT
jgi:hypothetical protein